MPKLTVPICLIDPLQINLVIFKSLRLSNRFLVQWRRIDEFIPNQPFSNFIHGNQPEIIIFNLDTNPPFIQESLERIKENSYSQNITLAVFTKETNKFWIEKCFESGANVFLRFDGELDEWVKKLNDLLLIHWQYSLGQFDRENFLLCL